MTSNSLQLSFQIGNLRNRYEVKVMTEADAVLVEGRMKWLDIVDPDRCKDHVDRLAATTPDV
jgi:hypothetical protein